MKATTVVFIITFILVVAGGLLMTAKYLSDFLRPLPDCIKGALIVILFTLFFYAGWRIVFSEDGNIFRGGPF
ncbi:MAG: hypothetical protein WC683_14045 [bacterium]